MPARRPDAGRRSLRTIRQAHSPQRSPVWMEVANTNSKADDIARISYDEQTAAAFKAVREVPRDGLSEWRGALRRHLRPSRGMTLVDIGAGTGAFAAAFSD